MAALPSIFAILDIGSTEILVIMLVVLLLFGSKRMPDLARSFGKTLREFKKATSGLEAELKRAMEEPPPPPPRANPRPAAATTPSAGSARTGEPPSGEPPADEPPAGFHYP